MQQKMAQWFKKYFVPHEGNHHEPHILRPRIIAFACIVALVAEFAFTLTTTYIAPRSKFFGIIEANALVDETNQARTGDNE